MYKILIILLVVTILACLSQKNKLETFEGNKKMKDQREKIETLEQQKDLIIKNTGKEYNDTFPNKIVSGNINSIKRITQLKKYGLKVTVYNEKKYLRSILNRVIKLKNGRLDKIGRSNEILQDY